MSSWARIAAGAVAEIVTLDPAGRYNPALSWVPCPDGTQQGALYAAGVFSAAPPVTPPAPAGRAHAGGAASPARHDRGPDRGDGQLMLRIKQGGTFLLTAMIVDLTGAPINLNAAQLAVALATSTGTPVGPVTITATDSPGQATVLGLASDTANWPVGILRGDITVSSSGLVIISDNFTLYIEQSVA